MKVTVTKGENACVIFERVGKHDLEMDQLVEQCVDTQSPEDVNKVKFFWETLSQE